MMYELKNECLTVEIASFGAEIHSIKSSEGRDYLWCGDAKFWARHSPVLFPIVGMVKGKKYTQEGKTYEIGQHGFARDMEFDLVRKSDDEIWFALKDNEETLSKYPFHFELQIGYRLEGNSVTVLWKVSNPDDKKMLHFSIGAHPAFVCPLENEENKDGYALSFDKKENLIYRTLNPELGQLEPREIPFETENGICAINENFFDVNTYVFENSQLHSVSILDKEKKPYVTVEFDAPLVGIWSPEKKNAPFVCIEPWYGRCDMVGFEGDFSEREHTQKVEPMGQFEASYKMIFN